ncbi:prolyl-tRNA synthetase associated domain-containing protein [Kiloniella laminariae]|uniref:Prolyl-tRNA synthetase associated domain-containing protein n=1 Tax=Kiloniella laminariae TaxID=454162 RepID=A0ABT4LJ61_9PROT|nr:prolyl-tRNA synthetase associated domain-containing protein [Kiloniella laminariae]MCZ4281129.1 prolyl-tRNA synthetase associated domain-containing protein [Kiloniella laminariae]
MTTPLSPLTPQQLLQKLQDLGIQAETKTHAPVFTVEESKALRGDLPGAHTKNLFLRNKKGQMWLLVCLEDRKIDIKTLGKALDAGKLSFGSSDRLMEFLGVEPGSVSAFAAINDRNTEVKVVLDQQMMQQSPINCHPLINSMTTALSPENLVLFLESINHSPELLDMDKLNESAQDAG